MVRPEVGDVVIIPFPYSDLTDSKKRPAVVVAVLGGDDVVLCMITSQIVNDSNAVKLTPDDFISGGLRVDSMVRPTRIFTADSNIIEKIAGRLKDNIVERIRTVLCGLFGGPC